MKKIYYIIIAIIALFVCRNVCAEDEEENLLAKCHYVSETKSGEKLEITVNVRKDYNLDVIIGNYGTSTQYVTYSLVNYDVSYENFIGDNGIATCDNVDKIYQYITTISDGATRKTSTTHYIQTKPIDPKPAGLSTGDYTYSYNEEGSKIYVSNNYDEEVMEKEGWLKICHYSGGRTLKFNKETYETDIVGLMESPGYYAEPLDIMSYLSSINYSCPTSLCSHEINGLKKHTFKMEYDKYCVTSQDFVSEYRCGSLDFYMKDYEKLKEEGSIALLNKKIERIKQFCDSVYQNQSYDDPTYCVKECMDIDKIFTTDMDLGSSGECGFSERLIHWIANIVRWVKYIVPVAVIVLGILDFMKAISADKDDEMKKAQQRFIRRLIAAAIIFIAPFIIEFILNKLGFAANGCGIINL